jgi:predicted transcriptional regulator
MDAVYLQLTKRGPSKVETLAKELDLEVDDVKELLADLHIDSIVTRCLDFYWVDNSYVELH